MSRDDSVKQMVEAFERNDEARERYKRLRNNPWMREAKLTRLFMFILVTLTVGSCFMGLFYLAYLIEGGWWWWLKYYSYGMGAIAGWRLSRHNEVFP